MTAKRLFFPLAGLAIGAALGWGGAVWRAASQHAELAAQPSAAAASAPAGRKVLYWYDPMSPTQRFDQPGKSPFMDMQLVPRYADEDQGEAAQAPGLAISAQAQQALGLRLARVERQTIAAELAAVGSVQFNDRDVSIVQARAAGFVERVYAHAPGDVVAAGAALVDVLNPEWLGAQQEFLAVRSTGDATLTQAARQRLLWLGMPATLVEQVERTSKVVGLQTITAPAGGVITELMVRQGMTVSPGMTLARINGLGTVWLEAALPEAQAAAILPGQAVEARFPAWPGDVIKGRVTAVLPEANRETRTLRVRIELPNPGQRLHAGMYAQVSLRGPKHEVLVVPAEAVIRTGRRALVYVSDGPGRYRPVEVEIGEQVDDRIVVRSGLAEGQQVVASGQFLVDSEASLQGVMARAATPVAAPLASVEYQTRGVVVELTPDRVTLDHEAVPALKWPAMTMEFKLADRSLASSLAKGRAVEFSFSKKGDDYLLTRAAPASAASGAAR